MVSAYILVETSSGETSAIQRALSEMKKGIKSAHTVTGPFDIIVLIEAKNLQMVGDIVTEKIRHLPGVTRTLTCVVVGDITSKLY